VARPPMYEPPSPSHSAGGGTRAGIPDRVPAFAGSREKYPDMQQSRCPVNSGSAE